MKDIEVFKLDKEAKIPTRAHKTDAGLDLYALENTFIPFCSNHIVKTGIAINVPEGYVGYIKDRSSMALKGLHVNGGVIDANYSGPLNVIIQNLTCRLHTYFNGHENEYGYWINTKDKIAQLTIHRVETPKPKLVDKLWSSDRGAKGFGSSDG